MDKQFIEYCMSRPNKKSIFSRLMKIKASSLDHKKTHNIILEEDFDKLISEGDISELVLSASIKKIKESTALSSMDIVTKRLLFAITLTSESPRMVYFFTTEELLPEYKKNKHYTGVKSVNIKSSQEALRIIDSYYNQFVTEREFSR